MTAATHVLFICANNFLKLQGQPSRYLLVQDQRLKHRNNTLILFKVSNKDTRVTALTSFWSLLLILNRFHTLLCCFHCWNAGWEHPWKNPFSVTLPTVAIKRKNTIATRSAFRNQSKIQDGSFFAKIVDNFSPLSIFAKKLRRRFSTGF